MRAAARGPPSRDSQSWAPVAVAAERRKDMHLSIDQVGRFVASLNHRFLFGVTIAELVKVWRPIVDAFEAGLFMYRFNQKEIICVPQPVIFVESGRLHRADGPAVEWFSEERQWLWHGVDVPAKLIQRPEQIAATDIRCETNAELRRCMIERFGARRLIKELGGEVVAKDKYGILWRRCTYDAASYRAVDGVEAEACMVVEVENGTVEEQTDAGGGIF